MNTPSPAKQMTDEPLDPWTLQRIPLAEKESLPNKIGLYFIFQDEKIIYIGKTEQGFYYRWGYGDHHRQLQLLAMSGNIAIACWEVPERGKELRELERAAVKHYTPPLNGARIPEEYKRIHTGDRHSSRKNKRASRYFDQLGNPSN